jgi:hypothetical protein
LTTTITVTGKRTEGDRHLVDLDCQLANDKGVAVVVGEATADLPEHSS